MKCDSKTRTLFLGVITQIVRIEIMYQNCVWTDGAETLEGLTSNEARKLLKTRGGNAWLELADGKKQEFQVKIVNGKTRIALWGSVNPKKLL